MQQNQLHWNFVSTVKAAERQRHLDSGRAKKQKNKDSMYLDHLSQQFFISDSASHANVLPLHCLKVSSRNFAAHWRYRKYMAAEQNNDSMTHRHRTRNQSNKSKFQNNYLIFFFGRQWMKWHFLNVLQTGSFQRVAAKVCVWRSSKENLTGVRLHQLSIHHQWTWITGWQWLRALFLSCHALSSKHVWKQWKFMSLMVKVKVHETNGDGMKWNDLKHCKELNPSQHLRSLPRPFQRSSAAFLWPWIKNAPKKGKRCGLLSYRFKFSLTKRGGLSLKRSDDLKARQQILVSKDLAFWTEDADGFLHHRIMAAGWRSDAGLCVVPAFHVSSSSSFPYCIPMYPHISSCILMLDTLCLICLSFWCFQCKPHGNTFPNESEWRFLVAER